MSYPSFKGLLKQQNDQLPVCVLFQLREHALHRYRRSHGFQSGTNLKLFQAVNCFNGFCHGNSCYKFIQIRRMNFLSVWFLCVFEIVDGCLGRCNDESPHYQSRPVCKSTTGEWYLYEQVPDKISP